MIVVWMFLLIIVWSFIVAFLLLNLLIFLSWMWEH